MTGQASSEGHGEGTSRRTFLKQVGRTTLAGSVTAALTDQRLAAAAPPSLGKIIYRTLGKTGLKVSEIGFGGHSWSYAKVPEGHGQMRKVTLDEATRMISLGLDLGVNFFDSCTPPEEHSVPGQVIKRLKKRDQIVISARLCHKMKGVAQDSAIIRSWVDERLKLWQTDRFDILMLTNEVGDTPQSGYWDMSHCLKAVEQLKRQGKIRFAGFGCHFTPEWFHHAFAEFGRAWDICSLPYNVRHRMADQLLPEAEELGLGIVTIKALARGSLLENRDPRGADAGLARDMVAFVLENPRIDCCIVGVHTVEQAQEVFSASWTRLTSEARKHLDTVSAQTPGRSLAWLERGWLSPAAIS